VTVRSTFPVEPQVIGVDGHKIEMWRGSSLPARIKKTKSAKEDFVSVVTKAFYGIQRTMIKLWDDVAIIISDKFHYIYCSSGDVWIQVLLLNYDHADQLRFLASGRVSEQLDRQNRRPARNDKTHAEQTHLGGADFRCISAE
jgi:hypothetical protein